MKDGKLILVMAVWGSLALFTRALPFHPVFIAGTRAFIALPISYFYLKKSGYTFKECLNFKKYYLSYICGMLIALNWAFLFLSFQKTSVANAVLTYNLAPIYVIIFSPIVLKIKITKSQVALILLAFLGLIIIMYNSLSLAATDVIGLVYGLIAGGIYAILMFVNKEASKKIASQIRTLIQMGAIFIFLLPAMIFLEPAESFTSLSATQILILLILGLVHTGFAYNIYFEAYDYLSTAKIALISYLEPVFAIIFAALLLNETLSPYQMIGVILIIGSALFKDIYDLIILKYLKR